MKKNPALRKQVKVFNLGDASADDIASAGEAFTRVLYGGSKEESLDQLRYRNFTQATVKSRKEVKLQNLPPTMEANKMHFFRVYYQVQVWRGNFLDPEKWGWKLQNNSLLPVFSLLPPAPEKLLHLITCSCVKGCGGRCTCKKSGLKCTNLCAGCCGISCSNAMEPVPQDDEYDDDYAEDP